MFYTGTFNDLYLHLIKSEQKISLSFHCFFLLVVIYFIDIELPLMGEKQFRSTFRSKKDPNSSPAVLDLLGSVRPKIYALLHILNCSRGELVEEVNDRYKISWRTLSVTDEVSI